MKTQKLLTWPVVRSALVGTLVKLNPIHQFRNPVMFLVFAGTLLCTGIIISDLSSGLGLSTITFQITLWLWFTVLFANFAESIAEAQGKARSDTLRKMRSLVTAHRVVSDAHVGTAPGSGALQSITEDVASSELRSGNLVICQTGDIIPGDGEVVEGIASVDESAITGESAPVIRESGGDRSSVTGGTRVISDRILVRIASDPGSGFIDRMIAMIEGAGRRKTPGELALTILLTALSAVFLVAVITLFPLSGYIATQANTTNPVNTTFLVALLVCLIPTTIASLLSAIGISGIARLMGRNVLATSGRAVEAAGDVDVLLIDKTGTITYGNRMATALVPAPGVALTELERVALLSSIADETAEGRSIVDFVKRETKTLGSGNKIPVGAEIVPFSARSRMSGLDFPGGGTAIRKGAIESIREWVEQAGGQMDTALIQASQDIARQGATPLAVAEGRRVLGIIRLGDVVKPGIRERFARLNSLGIRTIMITGDNPLTAAAIANEAGVADYIAEARPETKLALIRQEQEAGHMVAMFGDGTNDAPALAQADVGMAMASGTQTAREAGNMVDFDSDPTKLLEVVETGKQLLITRGSLTTFSIANDVAKYFAILPALFTGFYASVAASGQTGFGPLSFLNIMQLASPGSAILSAVIFNALIIVALIPLALRGVSFKPGSAASLLQRNMLVFGLGGLVVPFIGIKLIDLAIHALGWA